LPIAHIRHLSNGAIVEFDKQVENPLDLLINNHPIGCGHVIKVGENFGLKVVTIETPEQRIRSLGR
jgi:flagellar motor switch protein FliN